MQIILLEHIEKVGAKHEVVKVKDGYGRNYLIPQGLALVANRVNMAKLDGMKKQSAKKEAALIEIYKGYAAKLADLHISIPAKAGESGRLFGSISAQNLVAALQEQAGIEVEKRIITMPDEVKELGEYTATIRFHPEVEVNAKFDVVAEG
jgi:large subunit ribosomal protein L9